MKANDTQSTLIRGFLIAEKIAKADRPLSSAYLAEELDLPKATVHRIAQQLEAEGLLRREPDGKRFVGGKRLRDLAIATLSNSVLASHRTNILMGLSEEVGETCNLVVLDGNEIVYLDRVETNWPYRIHLPIGSHLPIYCTATGKLFLASMTGKKRDKVLNSLRLRPHTERTIVDLDELKQQILVIEKDGVSVDTGEFLEGMISIAVPVIGKDNHTCMAIAIHAPSARRSLDELRQYLPALRTAAGKIAEADCSS